MGYSPRGHKDSGTTERLHFLSSVPLEEMATHSRVLAWSIRGRTGPGGAWDVLNPESGRAGRGGEEPCGEAEAWSQGSSEARGAGCPRRPRTRGAAAGPGPRSVLRRRDAGRRGALRGERFARLLGRLSCPLVAPAALLSASPQAIAFPWSLPSPCSVAG